MTAPSYAPDYYFAQVMRDGKWIAVTSSMLPFGVATAMLSLPEAIDTVRRVTDAQWRRIVKSSVVWNEEGETRQQDNGCLPGKHCLSKSRDCMVNGCIRQLQEINAYDGVLMFICGDLIKSAKATT